MGAIKNLSNRLRQVLLADSAMKRKPSDHEIIVLSSDDESTIPPRVTSHRGNLNNERSADILRPSSQTPAQSTPQPIEDDLYARIANIFPGISLEYVKGLCNSHRQSTQRDSVEMVVVNEIVNAGTYPKQEDRKRRKLSHPTDNVKKAWGPDDGVHRDYNYHKHAITLLKLDYPNVPTNYIDTMLRRYLSIFATHAALHKAESSYETTKPPPYKRRPGATYDPHRNPNVPSLSCVTRRQTEHVREFLDAREERLKTIEAQQREKDVAEREAQNEATCIANGNIMECQCCYADVPINRTIPCTGEELHFFCYACVKTSAKTQVGIMKYEIKCMDMSGCAASFDKGTLTKAIGKPLIKKLEELQQRDEIAKAGIEDLHECPFCDFKAICPPVEQDREFRCENPECRKVSCRLCNLVSHIPKTCEEANDKKTPARQKIEEAMSEALIRTCPKCKVKIVKEDGCNKMTCVKCRTIMCYVCKKNITKEGYSHFDKTPDSCPVHDRGIHSRHYKDVSDAQKKAMEEVLKANPDLKVADLAVDAPTKENNRYVVQQRHGIVGRHVNVGPYLDVQGDIGFFAEHPPPVLHFAPQPVAIAQPQPNPTGIPAGAPGPHIHGPNWTRQAEVAPLANRQQGIFQPPHAPPPFPMYRGPTAQELPRPPGMPQQQVPHQYQLRERRQPYVPPAANPLPANRQYHVQAQPPHFHQGLQQAGTYAGPGPGGGMAWPGAPTQFNPYTPPGAPYQATQTPGNLNPQPRRARRQTRDDGWLY
ncbi:hypothetical protein FQN50_000994 [Emmonsiellopsis sp. PD_5]|nr:hypothetical protein FQN50_000994 [Emmonsiellopsis sp. PD_5]